MSDDSENGCLAALFSGICSVLQYLFECFVALLTDGWKLMAGLSPLIKGLIITFFTTVGLGVITLFFHKSTSNMEATSVNLLDYLPGTYYVSIQYDGKEQETKTAKIEHYSENEYRAIMVSEYSPEYILIQTNEEGNLSSQSLGNGKLYYNHHLNKVTVIFEKGRYVWKMMR